MRFVQLLYVPGPSETVLIWGLDPNGEIWECDYRRAGMPLVWQQLEFGKPVDGDIVSTRAQEQINGAEKFRAAVLKYIREIQEPGEPMHDLAGEVEKLDILKALGLK
jgi:hypothetical protein